MPGEHVIGVDDCRDGDAQVIRAERAGIDPDKDVELTVMDGTLRIDAERRVEKDAQDKGYNHQLRCRRFTRTLPLPAGATEADISATYMRSGCRSPRRSPSRRPRRS